MIKFLKVTGKAMAFFGLWLILTILIDWPIHDPVLWRFNAEMVPLAIIIVLSIVFWLIDRHEFPLLFLKSPIKNIFTGVFVGLNWVGIAFVILLMTNQLTIIGTNSVGHLGTWIFACFLNVCMQGLLVRGYIYQSIRANYSVLTAIIIGTLLFTLLHGGAFEAGILAVLNVFTMSLFMFVAYEASECWLFPTMIHFVWNAVGGIILGAVNLATDYPSILDLSAHDPSWMSGGDLKLEGSIVVLILNLIFTVRYLMKWRYNMRRKKAVYEEMNEMEFYEE